MAVDVNAIQDALGAALAVIPGLRVYDYEPDAIAPPAAIVRWDEIAYDETMARGVDRATFSIFVAVTSNSDRASRDAVSAYLAGTGPASVKTAVDGTLGGLVKDARVAGSKNEGPVTVGAVVYYGASFTVEVFS